MAQLLGIAHYVDRNDAAMQVLECHGIDRTIFFAEDETGEAVDGSGAPLRARQRRGS